MHGKCALNTTPCPGGLGRDKRRGWTSKKEAGAVQYNAFTYPRKRPGVRQQRGQTAWLAAWRGVKAAWGLCVYMVCCSVRHVVVVQLARNFDPVAGVDYSTRRLLASSTPPSPLLSSSLLRFLLTSLSLGYPPSPHRHRHREATPLHTLTLCRYGPGHNDKRCRRHKAQSR